MLGELCNFAVVKFRSYTPNFYKKYGAIFPNLKIIKKIGYDRTMAKDH